MAKLMQSINPPSLPKPAGYSHAWEVQGGKTVYIAGQVGWSAEEKFVEKSFGGQFRQALANIVAVLAEAGGRPEHIVRLTWFVIDRDEYMGSLKEVGAAYREIIGKHYPAMSVVQVAGLVEAGARLEIEATAVVPD